MSERPVPFGPGNRWEDLKRLGESDPKLLELVTRARDALDDLAAYLGQKALDAGATLPEEMRRYVEKHRQEPDS